MLSHHWLFVKPSTILTRAGLCALCLALPGLTLRAAPPAVPEGNLDTQLLSAAAGEDARLVGFLLKRGADIEAKDNFGYTPLMIACQRGRTEAVKTLLAGGADVEAKDVNGSTPLIWAAIYGESKAAGLLLDHGADIAAKDKLFGRTALIRAAEAGHTNTARLLWDSGADPQDEDAQGHTALDLAAANQHDDTVAFLKTALVKKIAVKHPAGTMAGSPLSTPGATALSKEDVQEIVQSAVAAVARPRDGAAAPAAAPIRSDVDEPAYRRPENPGRWAVVVGIESYADKDLPKAAYAVRDAQAVQKHLVALGFPPRNILLLTADSATRSRLISALRSWLPNRIKPGATVFFYFSGHGAPDAGSKQAYLVPYDGDPEDLLNTAYPLHDLYEGLAALKAAHTLVVLDSCFSGRGGRSVIAPGTRPLVAQFKGDSIVGPMAAMSAAASDGITGMRAEDGHGIFTYYFLKGLNGKAADPAGAVTVKGLFDYLRPQVEDESRLHNRAQAPQLTLGADSEGALRLR